MEQKVYRPTHGFEIVPWFHNFVDELAVGSRHQEETSIE
jgi:hypothetical protein